MPKNRRIDDKNLLRGIGYLNIVPIRLKYEETSMMISQLLFGETFSIILKKNKNWVKIQTDICQNIGWVKTNQIQLLNESDYQKLRNNTAITLEIVHPAFDDSQTCNVVLGSRLPLYDGISTSIYDKRYVYNGQAIESSGLDWQVELFTKIAKRYLHSPELFGGRSPFGIENGAFVQIVMSYFKVLLPMQPNQQLLYGEAVHFAEEAKEGDLALFEDKEGNVHHCGLIIEPKKIIHVYGKVRIDKFDHFGIYNKELKKYTHQLRIIKRLVG